MRTGDLVIMPGETVLEGSAPSVGIVIDDVPQFRHQHSTRGRVGILWANWHQVEYEPSDWLKVIGTLPVVNVDC